MKKLNLKNKIVVPVIVLAMSCFVVLFAVILTRFQASSTEMQDMYVEEFAYHNLYNASKIIEKPLDEARAMAVSLGGLHSSGDVSRQDVVDMLGEWLEKNDSYVGVYTAWEPNAFDGADLEFKGSKYHDGTGRFVPYVYRTENGYTTEALVDYETLEYYQKPKTTMNEIVTDPYEYQAGEMLLHIVSMCVPITIDGEFKGIVGVDVGIGELLGLVDNTTLFETGNVAVLTSDGTIVAHKDKEIIGVGITDFFAEDDGKLLLDSISNGELLNFDHQMIGVDGEYNTILTSVPVGNTGDNWAVITSVLIKEKNAAMTTTLLIAIIIGIIMFSIVVISLLWIVNKYIAKPMKQSIDQIKEASGQVSASSQNLADSSQQLSQGASEQAASIEETSATMDETASMVKQNADNTKKANELSKQATNVAVEGADKMKDMMASMEELKKSSADISKIIKVIDDIAFQTNMLALNAAVEAARAGDAGLGFAVVAEEVRNLAGKSAKAAKDTAEIIDRNIELSEQGVTISTDVNASLEEIIESINGVDDLIGQVTAASEEQARGTAQVTTAIGQMEQVVQSNAATAEESAASSEQLYAQALELGKVVVDLVKMADGSNAKINDLDLGKQIEEIAQDMHEKRDHAHEKIESVKKQIISADDVIPLDNNDEF